jgi:hypothetical protein
MTMGHVGMMPRLFMSSTLMMLGGLTMAVSRLFVVVLMYGFGRLYVA